jgi:hypothetical protein
MYTLNHSMEKIKGPDIEDLEHSSQLLVKSMVIREKYMALSQQTFSNTAAKYINMIFSNEKNDNFESDNLEKSNLKY